MSRIAQQSTNWEFTVSQHRITNPVTGQSTGFWGNFRDDTGELLGTTSDQYGILQNTHLIHATRTALAAMGLGAANERISVLGRCGERLYAEFTIGDKRIASGVGDLFGYRLVVQNSFDRSQRASVKLGFLRLACTNGMATLESEVAMTARHSATISTAFVEKALSRALTGAQASLAVYDELAARVLPTELGVNVLGQLVAAKALTARVRDDIMPLWLNPRRKEDEARNVYNLYNAITEHLTAMSTERVEYAADLTGTLLFRLVNAVRNQNHWSKLTAPVPASAVVVEV